MHAVDDTLFGQLDPPVLAGSACDDCEVVAFPPAARCPGCAGAAVSRRPLPTRGTVWTWTTQAFAPKPPFDVPASGFEPFVVGYVDLGGVLVESRIVGTVAIGDDVELRLLPVGDAEVTFAFGKVTS
ncbi:hypothetical protein ASG56_06470 [Rhodococcus sp. Leaf7]|uniref:Zn-ribbon domain-containing OB-fold protein n=1 Tax=unclassified Rhodococcus (in: high G+C Gram-positive bacteria) TaxID=192944 RepID=UPI0006F36249|nr:MULTISPECIES: OB-fold domain-containing protein [unclassified Rhodococcus (in: high G+C Gram-positive bacteria)]KQU07178.1 hypothetical protein ASG56_06470 [Rhodococcus sp. Leaf7]KQU42696.1 hypothetical protein ASG64_06470 [Rhodococcus sp. Leaf247]